MVTEKQILQDCKNKYLFIQRKLNSVLGTLKDYNKLSNCVEKSLINICDTLFDQYSLNLLPQVVNYSDYNGVRFNIYINVNWYTVSQFVYYDLNSHSFTDSKLQELIKDLIFAYYCTQFNSDGTKPINSIVDSFDLIEIINKKFI